MSKGVILVLVVVALIVGAGAGYAIGIYSNHPTGTHSLSVYAAGSAKNFLGDQFVPAFENMTGLKTGVTFGGSVSDAEQIKAGAATDVFISAAAGVIPQYLMSNYTNWMVIFATNEMAITWNDSNYAISGPYWFENISAPTVKVAVSNSSLDPSGFQAIETIKLAGILYTNWSNPYVREAFGNNSHGHSDFLKYNEEWNAWFGPNGTLEKDHSGGGYPVNDSMALYDQIFIYKWQVTHNLLLSTVEEDLNGYLDTGAADYAITYKSQAINQHLSYYETGNGTNALSSWITLGNITKDHVMFYAEVNTSGPAESNIGNFPGSPILYAATIITSSKNTQEAQQFIYYLITSLGNSKLTASDFDPISTPFLYAQLYPESPPVPSFLSDITQPVPGYIPASSYEQV